MKNLVGMTNAWFVLCGESLDKVNRGGSLTLIEGYTDHNGLLGPKGAYVKYVAGKDRFGQEKAKRFRLSESLRRLLVRDSDVDATGQLSLYDFLKNHPQTEGSPYGTYEEDEFGVKTQVGIVIRELDTERDAEVALEADQNRIKAQSAVLEMDAVTLEEVGSVLGYYGDAEKVLKLKVLEFAGKRPSEFFAIMNSDNRAIRAVINKAISEGIFKTKGDLIIWGDTTIGTDENSAIATLKRDEKMLEALQEKLSLSISNKKEKRPRGNPNFVKKQ